MSPFLQLILAISIIVTVAKTGGYISTRLGQPAVLGELVAGLLLGPSLLDMLHWAYFTDPHLGETIHELAEFGVLLLMFVAGIEVDLESMRKAGKVAVLGGSFGVVVPVGLGLAAALAFGFALQEGLLIGLILAATSVSISAQTLMELNVLRSREGVALLGAAIVDDVLVILGLSILIALVTPGGADGVAWLLLRMVIYLTAIFLLGMYLLPWLAKRVSRLAISEGTTALAVVVALLSAWSAEVVGGIAGITGAFLAGVFFARTPIRQVIEGRLHTLAYGLFVPIFFVGIGLSADLHQSAAEGLAFTAVVIAVALTSKVIGSGMGAKLGGFSVEEALRFGVGMTSRGEVGLIVATVGLTAGLIDEALLATMVVMVPVTTLVTPPVLRWLFARGARPLPAPAAVGDLSSGNGGGE